MINVILADDHEIMLDGYSSIFQNIDTINVVGLASNGKEVLTILESTPCDLVLLDINMPKMDGLETAQFLRANKPTIKIIVMTMLNNISYVKQMIDQHQVEGYLLKNCGKKIMLEAIEKVTTGNKYFDSSILEILESGFKNSFEINNEVVKLSEREIEIIRMIALGMSTNNIANELFISPFTVQTHRKNINSKLQIHKPSELTKFAIRHNILPSNLV